MITGFILFECLSEEETINVLKDFSGCNVVYKFGNPKERYTNLYIYGEMPKDSEYETFVDDELWEGNAAFEELKKKFESK